MTTAAAPALPALPVRPAAPVRPALPALPVRPALPPGPFSTLTGTHPLDPETIERYRRDGHLLVPGLAAAEEVAPFVPVIAEATARHTASLPPLAERDTYGQAFLQVMNLWRDDEQIARLVLAERFASTAARLLGVERVRVYHDQALFKEPGGGFTPWHQDATYWPVDGHHCTTMWMPLVDIVPEMGGLTFGTGSHVDGPLSDVTISDASEAHFDAVVADRGFALAQPLPMRAGDATFHGGWTVHRAGGNRTDTLRAVMTVIYLADGLTVQRPTNSAQENDLRTWLPGLRPGDFAASPLNPVVG
jgi:hypothetical protein